jgi:hypothetical protein
VFLINISHYNAIMMLMMMIELILYFHVLIQWLQEPVVVSAQGDVINKKHNKMWKKNYAILILLLLIIIIVIIIQYIYTYGVYNV